MKSLNVGSNPPFPKPSLILPPKKSPIHKTICAMLTLFYLNTFYSPVDGRKVNLLLLSNMCLLYYLKVLSASKKKTSKTNRMYETQEMLLIDKIKLIA